MRNETPLLEPGSRPRNQHTETTRLHWKPPLPEASDPRLVPLHRAEPKVPYLLAPRPWPQGQFRVDPEA